MSVHGRLYYFQHNHDRQSLRDRPTQQSPIAQFD
jgi:hypothetical protein